MHHVIKEKAAFNKILLILYNWRVFLSPSICNLGAPYSVSPLRRYCILDPRSRGHGHTAVIFAGVSAFKISLALPSFVLLATVTEREARCLAYMLIRCQ